MSSPQASSNSRWITASPAARMFFAALRSLSCRVPHPKQVQDLSESLSLLFFPSQPGVEQSLLDGCQRPITMRRFPYHCVLYSIRVRNSPHPESEMDFAWECRADWPSGVARSEKAAQRISAAGKAAPRAHAGTYLLNERLDTDSNGVVCEDKKTGAQLLSEAIRETTR